MCDANGRGSRSPCLLKGGGYKTGRAKLYAATSSSLQLPEIQALSCSLCKHVLRDPMQVTTCGCRYCAGCIETLTNESTKGPFACVIDHLEYEKNDIRKDRGCQREIEGLEIDCPTEPEPCPWRGKLTAMEEHMETKCPKRLVFCSQGCGGQYREDELEYHMTTECTYRVAECKYCDERIPELSMQDHYTSCLLAPVKCEFCHQVLESKSKLSQHHDACVEYQVSCPYSGCSFKSGKKVMNEHLMTSHILEIAQESASTHKEIVAVRSANQALQSQVCHLTSQVDELLHSHEIKDAKIKELKKVVDYLVGENKSKECATLQGASCIVEVDSVTEKQTEKLSRGSKKTEDTTRDTAIHSKGGEEVESQLKKMSESILEIQDTVSQHGIALEDMRLRQDVLDVKSTNGVLVWKIPDVRRRYREAVERKTISLYSPPFYTSPHGYRVCIRVYLNGDGIGKGTHISLFFFIMRSEHDNLLTWPFKQSVRFTLIHQKKTSLSISESFVPDPNSPSFKKPERDLNIASGFPKFARQSVLQDEGFTQDNLIYIKCQVDLSGLTSI